MRKKTRNTIVPMYYDISDQKEADVFACDCGGHFALKKLFLFLFMNNNYY